MNSLRIGFFLTVCWSVLLLPVTDWLSFRYDPAGRVVFRELPSQEVPERGAILDAWRGVPVVHNGTPYWKSHGRHFADAGYYYGKKWQCVEYIKRFYFDVFGHEMPDVMGHARSFFDPETGHGMLNTRRGMLQFANGADEPPRPDDLMVWRYGNFGHVAVVTQVEPGAVQVIQQNVIQGTRQWLPRRRVGSQEWIGIDGWMPSGWLRIAEK